MFLIFKEWSSKCTRRIWILVLLTVIYSCSKNKQNENVALYQKILPGNNQMKITTDILKSYKYSKPFGSMAYDIKKTLIGNNEYWQLNIDFIVNGKASPDTVYFDAKTLAFYKRSFKNSFSKYKGVLKFENNKLNGQLVPYSQDSKLKSPLMYDKVFRHGVFEPATLNYVLGVLPLKDGYKVSLPMLDLNNGASIIWANVEVIGKENVSHKGKTYSAWKVLSKGSREKIFWIDVENKFMVKMKNKGVWFQWKLVES